jgi:polar amino acid transport system substrate-binding protein
MMQAAASPLQLAKMVAFDHGADYMFIDWEDYDYIYKDGEITALGLQPLDFPDLPPGLNRYLMCSTRVDDQIMEKLNRTIRELLPDLNP